MLILIDDTTIMDLKMILETTEESMEGELNMNLCKEVVYPSLS